jgi:hypothetical protein
VADQLTAIAELLRTGRLGALSRIAGFAAEASSELPRELRGSSAEWGRSSATPRVFEAQPQHQPPLAPSAPDLSAPINAIAGDLPGPHRRNADLARQIYAFRRRRGPIFGDPELFGEPAWDILLDLYVAQVDGKPVSVSSACIGSASPPTTGLRWLGILAQRDLIVREQDPDDQRRVLVRLSDRGLAAMDGFLSSLLSSIQRCAPGG